MYHANVRSYDIENSVQAIWGFSGLLQFSCESKTILNLKAYLILKGHSNLMPWE